MSFQEGDKVEWDWGQGTAEGQVAGTHTKSITRTIKGTEVTRNGSDEDPALEIKQDDGTKVLKLASEVRKR
ncbi:DUF2945 domain-containing protein [Yoonia sp. SS1-5]|uniref:DUF2945 domain-containing protein n=1 Tax=Yoonia rhodophyticola TaxID=3137370 RepID=A0AAN0NM82_9RHOB